MNRGNGQTIKATEIQADVLCLPKVNVGEWMINQNAQNASTMEVLSKLVWTLKLLCRGCFLSSSLVCMGSLQVSF